jgi:hypothetical protein
MRSALPLALVLTACGAGAVDGNGGGSGADGGGEPDQADAAAEELAPFSFFVTSLEKMRELSGSNDGFGGDLGGLDGADGICQEIAASVGFGGKTWRAFLSVAVGPGGTPVHAVDRIGEGPWFDRNGRMVASGKGGLLEERPDGDPQITSDLPNERGEGQMAFGDTHDVMTGTNQLGQLDGGDPGATCQDWTSDVGPGSEGQVRCGHSWPAESGQSWVQAHQLRGCAPGVNLEQNGGGTGDCVGCSGGYGAIYCFALTP